MADKEPLSPERVSRREEIKRLTQRGTELYEALKTNADKRNELIVAEMADGAVAREISEVSGLTVARIYRLRDNGLNKE